MRLEAQKIYWLIYHEKPEPDKPETDTFTGIILEDTIAWEKIVCSICIYLPETDNFIGMIMFCTVHHWKSGISPMYRETPSLLL